MKKIYLIFLLISTVFFGQNGFELSNNKKRLNIPFQLINNLIIIPVNINGVDLNFLLDTGVENTIFFSLEDTKEITFENVESIKIKGLGSGLPLDAMKSKGNTVSINEYVDKKHEIYIVLDQEVNFSSQLGIPVHGIIGYQFFKNHLVEINFNNRKISLYSSYDEIPKKKLKGFQQMPISVELEKPYINLNSRLNDKNIQTKLLIDSGNTDAVWLFEDENIKPPTLNFEDYLGRGFSGDIHGKRSRIERLSFSDNLYFDEPTASFPEQKSLEGVDLVSGRNGSIGAGILRRFNVIFDYKNNKIFIKKNAFFNEPFNYNMSGIEVEHAGLQYIEEKVFLTTSYSNVEFKDDRPQSFKYQFALKPVYKVTSVRKDSPAALVGILPGDELKKINGVSVYKYKLSYIIELLQSEEGKWISIEYERGGVSYKTKFQLKKIL